MIRARPWVKASLKKLKAFKVTSPILIQGQPAQPKFSSPSPNLILG